jgi:hypothetical protein
MKLDESSHIQRPHSRGEWGADIPHGTGGNGRGICIYSMGFIFLEYVIVFIGFLFFFPADFSQSPLFYPKIGHKYLNM